MCVCVCMYLCMYACMHAYMYASIHTCKAIHSSYFVRKAYCWCTTNQNRLHQACVWLHRANALDYSSACICTNIYAYALLSYCDLAEGQVQNIKIYKISKYTKYTKYQNIKYKNIQISQCIIQTIKM